MNDLPSGWRQIRLEDVCEVNPRDRGPSDSSVLVSFIPMPAVSDRDGQILEHEPKPFVEVSKGYTRFREGDVIFAKITPCMENGKIAIARSLHNGLACGSTEFHVLRPSADILPEYLWRFLRQNSFRSDAERHMTGAVGQRRVPAQYIKDATIPLPPVPEQRRMVAKLDSLLGGSKNARDELARIPRLVERYRQAIFDAAFRGFLTAQWRLEHAEEIEKPTEAALHEALAQLSARMGIKPWQPKQYDNYPFLDVPTCWLVRRVRDVALHRSGAAFKSGRFGASGIQVVRLGNLYQGRLDLDRTPVFIAQPTSEERTFVAKSGDILVSQTGTRYRRDYGHCVLLNSDDRELLINQRILCLSPTPSVLPKFLAYYGSTPSFRNFFFDRETGGVNQGNVGVGGVMDAPCPLPSLAEQREIVRRLDDALGRVDRVLAEVSSALALVERLDNATLSKAFRGELFLADINEDAQIGIRSTSSSDTSSSLQS